MARLIEIYGHVLMAGGCIAVLICLLSLTGKRLKVMSRDPVDDPVYSPEELRSMGIYDETHKD